MENFSPLIGCCGWSGAKDKYFAEFPAVEVQTTFYELPSVATASKWRALAPDSFRFCLKAWQLITHAPSSPTYRKLKTKISASDLDSVGYFRLTEQVLWAWERTAEIGRELRAEVVLFQCPASFRAEADNIRNLSRFFSSIKREEFKLAWEPRGDWPYELVADICRDLELMRCTDPFGSDDSVAAAQYWRLHGKRGYSYRYTDEDLSILQDGLSASDVTERPQYIFFNNIWMKEDALRFRRLLNG